MKKILAIALVMVLALSLLTACGGDNNSGSSGNNNGGGNNTPSGNSGNGGGNNSGNNGGNVEAGQLTMSITVPSGWTEANRSADGTITYELDPHRPGTHAYLRVDDNLMERSERDYVERRITQNKEYSHLPDEYDYSPITEMKLDGHNALEYTITTKGESGVVARFTFIVKSDYVYSLEGFTEKEFWNDISKDFDAMRDSLTLK